MVAVYSYFASVKSEKSLEYMGLGFIGIINQSSRQYPMSHLQSKQFTRRINYYILVYDAVDEVVPEMMVFEWVDRDRCYFIETRGSLEEIQDVLRQRWLQVVAYVNSYAHMVDLDTLNQQNHIYTMIYLLPLTGTI